MNTTTFLGDKPINRVNDLIREALHPYPESLKLVTKVGARRDDAGRVLPAQRPDELRAGRASSI